MLDDHLTQVHWLQDWPYHENLQNIVLLLTAILWSAGLIEHFRDKCGGVPRWLDKETSYIAFQEGWALYAESPLLSDDSDLYEDNFLQLYGMLKWQVRHTGESVSNL